MVKGQRVWEEVDWQLHLVPWEKELLSKVPRSSQTWWDAEHPPSNPPRDRRLVTSSKTVHQPYGSNAKQHRWVEGYEEVQWCERFQQQWDTLWIPQTRTPHRCQNKHTWLLLKYASQKMLKMFEHQEKLRFVFQKVRKRDLRVIICKGNMMFKSLSGFDEIRSNILVYHPPQTQ